MRVVSYLKSVPAKNLNPQKTELLVKFNAGVNQSGDQGILHAGNDVIVSDVGMIQGWVYADQRTPHLQLRKQIIDQQLQTKKYVACADANLFLYKDKTIPHGYLRYSFNGIFPTTGIYCDTEVDPARWQQISKDSKIHLEDYKTDGHQVLLLLQRDGGWTMNGLSTTDWAVNTVVQLRKHTNRPIVLRAHPGDKKSRFYMPTIARMLQHERNVKISAPDTPLEIDLHNAWAVVNHNSSASVGPTIQGYHTFLTDPKLSQSKEVANTNLEQIETPKEFDRQRWLERISMFHWKFNELENGEAWNHLRKWIT